MDELKRELSVAGVQFTERVFASADSISGLGNKPFVSCYYNTSTCTVFTLNSLNIMLHLM